MREGHDGAGFSTGEGVSVVLPAHTLYWSD